MLSRLAVPIQRGIFRRSNVCYQIQSIHLNTSFQKYKDEKNKVKMPVFKRELNDQNSEKLSENHKSIPQNKPLLVKNDSEVFGLYKKSTEKEPDKTDLADEEYHRNYVLRKHQLPQKRYESMIASFIRDQRLKEAIDVLEVTMKEDRVKPDYYIYQLLIIECGRLGYAKKAFKLYNQMKKRGLKVSGPTYAALFNACARSIHPKEALSLAQNLRKIIVQNGYQANEIVYNSMIKAFGRCDDDIETSFQLVDEMKEKKLQLKIDTMNHLLQVCCSDKEHGFRHALIVWHKMYHRNLTPDVFSYNLLLRCTRDCGIGDFDEMRKVIEHVLRTSKADVKLKKSKNEILLIEDKPATTIGGKNIEVAEKPKTEVATEEIRDQMPNLLSKLPHLGSIIQLSMVNSPEDRLTLLGGLTGFITELENNKVRPDVKTFSQLMDSIPSTKEAEHELIEKMRYMRVRADTDFFNLLMKRRIVRKDYEGAKQIMGLLKKVNLDPDIATYGILAMSCVTREQSKEFIETLTEKGIRLNIIILGALLNNAIYIKDYDFVIDILEYSITERLKPSNKFMEVLNEFEKSCYFKLRNRDENDEEYIKFKGFYKVYKKWKVHNNLVGCSGDDISKALNVHPWKQIKEGEGEGLEYVKNSNIRRYWKKQHALVKLTPTRLKNLQNPKGNTDKK